MLTQKEIHNLFEYVDGKLYWKIDNRSRKVKGEVAGWKNNLDYHKVCINSKQYAIHQLIWILHKGQIPNGKIIDHVDGNPYNNKIENLRIASLQENQYNCKLRKDNTSGIKGVSWDKRTSKWKVQLMIYGKKKGLGYYKDLELAQLVVAEARRKYHGEFSNNGEI